MNLDEKDILADERWGSVDKGEQVELIDYKQKQLSARGRQICFEQSENKIEAKWAYLFQVFSLRRVCYIILGQRVA